MTLPNIDVETLVDFLCRLLNTPSPTGFAERAIALTEADTGTIFSAEAAAEPQRRAAGGMAGRKRGTCPAGLTAHVDTLGAMVKEIKANGRLKLTQMGGYAWNTIEGEGVTVFPARGGAAVRGSVLLIDGLGACVWPAGE